MCTSLNYIEFWCLLVCWCGWWCRDCYSVPIMFDGKSGLGRIKVRGGDMVFGVGGVKRGDENCDIKQQLENFPSFACSSSSRGIMRVVVVLLVGVRVCE